MTSLFDGMTGLLADVFGSPVTLTPVSGAPVTLRAVFREVPFDEGVADGRSQVALVPVLHLRAPDAGLVGKGATCDVGGRTFRLRRPVPSGSPASDAFVIWEMEQVAP